MPVKITGNRLAARCQVFYRRIYGIFLQCTIFRVYPLDLKESLEESRNQIFENFSALRSEFYSLRVDLE